MASKSTNKKTTKTSVLTQTTSAPKQSVAKKKPEAKEAVALAIKAVETASRPVAPVAKPVARVAKTQPTDDKQKVTFTYFAPQAEHVSVAGDFTRWEVSPINLVKAQDGHWQTTVALKPGKYQYRLLVDGQWQNDPECSELQPNEFGSANCVRLVA